MLPQRGKGLHALYNYQHFYCPGRPGRLSALSVFLFKSLLHGAFVWARKALNRPKRRFPARAGWLVGPPLILPVYFHIDNLKFLLHTKSLTDLLWTLTFFIRWCASPNRPGRADTRVCPAVHSSAG